MSCRNGSPEVNHVPDIINHKHRCPKCGSVWEHSNLCVFAPDLEWDRLHTCPVCKKVVKTGSAYAGPCPPTFSHYPPPKLGGKS